MKKKNCITFLLFFLMFLVNNLSAQAPSWLWAKSAPGNSYDEASWVTTDQTGNIYFAGYFYNDTIVLGTDSLFNSGMNDIFLVKYNSNGNVIWAKKAGGNGDDYVSAVTTDHVGNVYITGWFGSSIFDFGTDTSLVANAGQPDIFIAKYNSSGNLLWARREGGTDYDIGNGIVTDPISGDVYLAGAFYNSNITIGTTTLINNGLYDILVAKYDPNGNPIWAKSSGGSLNDLGNAIALDKTGNVIVDGGYASSSISFPCGTLTNAGVAQPDIFVVKYDANGNSIWARTAGSIDNDHAVSVAVDTSENIFVAGHYHSTSFTFGSDVLTNMGMGDIFLLKYDSSGNPIWGRSAGGASHDFGYCVTVDQEGNSYYCGMFTSASLTFGSSVLTNASSNEDIFLTKYDPAGNSIWSMRAGNTGRDYMNCVTIGPMGNLYVVGVFDSQNVMFGSTTLTNSDSSALTGDIFVGKLDVVTGNVIPLSENNSDETAGTIFPNPSNGVFKINLHENEFSKIEVFNSEGKKIIEQQTSGQVFTEINLENYSSGIYFLRLSSDEKIVQCKLIKE